MLAKPLFSVIIFFTLASVSLGWAADEGYAKVGADVSFDNVLNLTYRESDYRISYGENPLQFGQLWLPDRTSLGTVIFIHGGCWLNEYSVDHSRALSTALALEGYAVWSIEYRRTGDAGGGWPGTFDDVVAGINKVRELSSYGITLESLAIVGHSAGGHLALLAGARSEHLLVEPDIIVGLAAITNLVVYSRGDNTCQPATPLCMRGAAEEREEAFYEANPGNHDMHSATFLLQGDIDQIVPPEQASLPEATTIILAGAGHFDWVHPGTVAFRGLVKILSKEL
jgi:acetyl esterase/lipase